ncbi:alpha/beta fold hydrolase [Aestuariicella hydrocarbonica]|uniref:Alpha/beta fold hydrolase n=1 Tax=Pseudomaricurvus hydrocarbonicus TaxID=1470433 RepID=A0A9E5JUI9_9GAMM|nr:alpha/beta hydrolase [Aestuariicella hydrocarbonica]NHO65569.1 alpha/beta fold hydrolase [Aestuariicella hydrocarbonica]
MPRTAVRNVYLNYEIVGQGEALVLLHGLGSRLEDWRAQTAYFSKSYKVIAVDFRGHGHSDKPSGPYSIPMFADDILHLLDQLGVDQFHLAGFSMGGMTAFQLAVNQPQRLKSLTIINSSPCVPYQTLSEKMTVWGRLGCIHLLGMARLGKLIGRNLFPRAEQKPLYDEFLATMKHNDVEAYIHSLKSFLGWDVTSRLHRLSMPVLVVSADHDYTPVSHKQRYCEHIPNCQLHVIEDSRHATPLDQPERLNGVVDAFLRSTQPDFSPQ